MASFTFKRYKGDPDPLPDTPRDLNAPQSLAQLGGTVRDGIGPRLPDFDATTNDPIVGAPTPARAWLALLPVNWSHVKIGQAGGARRLFPAPTLGARNQTGTVQARESQRIVRPAAGPWDRGGAVGGT
mgnify:CR=1 FL=1|jgi:hypothetical protein